MKPILKSILITALFIFSQQILIAQDDKVVTLTVSGQGKTVEEAKTNGFRSAIEQAYGVYISSKTEILNDKIIKDEIVSISNGNIKEFKILNQVTLPNGDHTIILNATVSLSRLTFFCESRGISIEFKGGLLAENIKLRRLQETSEIAILNNLSRICNDILANSFDYSIKYDPPKLNTELKKWEIPLTITINQNQNIKNLGFQIYPVLQSIGLSSEDLKQYEELNLPFYNIFFAVQGDQGPAPAVISLRTEKGMKIVSDIILSFANGLLNFNVYDGVAEFSWDDLNKFTYNDYPFNNFLTYQNVPSGYGGKYLSITNNSPIAELLINKGYYVKTGDFSLKPDEFLEVRSNASGNYPRIPFPSAKQQSKYDSKPYTQKITESDRKHFGINETKYSFLDVYPSAWPQWDIIFSLVHTPGEAVIKFSKFYDEVDLEKISGFKIQRKETSLN